jgi:hypothetical protein
MDLIKCEQCGRPFDLQEEKKRKGKRVCLRCKKAKREIMASDVVFEYNSFFSFSERRRWNMRTKKKVKQAKKRSEVKGRGKKIYEAPVTEKKTVSKIDLIRSMHGAGKSIEEITKSVRAVYQKEGRNEAWLDFNVRGRVKWELLKLEKAAKKPSKVKETKKVVTKPKTTSFVEGIPAPVETAPTAEKSATA